jgi:hypothetical protein
MLRQTPKSLVPALDGSIFLDHPIAFRGRGEDHPHGKLGLVPLWASKVTVV